MSHLLRYLAFLMILLTFPLVDLELARGEIVAYRGELSDKTTEQESGYYADFYYIDVSDSKNVKQKIIIDLISSDFDTFLAVISPSNKVTINDDYSSTQRSHIELLTAQNGRWKIIVTSYKQKKIGSYQLIIDSKYPLHQGRKFKIPTELKSQIFRQHIFELGNLLQPRPKTAHPKLYPKFPFPPPPASARAELDTKLFRKSGNKKIFLRDINQKLSNALQTNGYDERSYYAIPEGFALVTKLEQIDYNGTWTKDRWSFNHKNPDISFEFSLIDFFKNLFFAPSGYYRLIVFLITSQPFSASNTTVDVTLNMADKWRNNGLNTLPKEIGDREYSVDYSITALVYEFEKLKDGKTTKLLQKSPLSATDHLTKAQILTALSK